jgi:hypothetical protein
LARPATHCTPRHHPVEARAYRHASIKADAARANREGEIHRARPPFR